ncbi:MAG: sulfotransferase family 2 domain-containing protein [Rhodobacteraceae bacterium]|nr:sulfotransferase family 2 domain-containing protein [Paracoccaceae bacterium]
MPIYPDHQLIFVHVPKTGGGTVTTILKPFETAARHSALRHTIAKLPFPKPPSLLSFGTHDSAASMKLRLGASRWDSWHSFSVVRNPYDRAISEFEYLRQTKDHRRHNRALRQSFLDFLRTEPRHRAVQTYLLTDGSGKLLVKELARFETLADDVNAILQRQGLPAQLDNQRRNTSEKKDRGHYLTDEAVKLINIRNADDFALLGYDKIT